MIVLALATAGLVDGGGAGGAPPQDEQENPIVALAKERLADPTKPFVLVVRFKAKEGKADAFEAAFKPVVAATLKEEGCLQYTLSRDLAQPGHFLLYEYWKDLETLRAHLKTPHLADLGKALAEFGDGAPEAAFFIPIAG
jgi:quinol monooxygenase YgiN